MLTIVSPIVSPTLSIPVAVFVPFIEPLWKSAVTASPEGVRVDGVGRVGEVVVVGSDGKLGVVNVRSKRAGLSEVMERSDRQSGVVEGRRDVPWRRVTGERCREKGKHHVLRDTYRIRSCQLMVPVLRVESAEVQWMQRQRELRIREVAGG